MLHFVDDQVVTAQDIEHLEFMTMKRIKENKRWGTSVNMMKTKYL